MKASVIICTYNRAGLLKESIQSVLEQDFPSDQFEIIVVDNNSTDNTRDVVKELSEKFHIPIKYIFEGKQGLSHARNRGIQEAHGEILTFLDDDSIAEKQWLVNLVSGYDDPLVVCVGGQIKLSWVSEKPEWLTPSMEIPLGKLNYGDTIKELEYPQTPFGGNISFRKSTLHKVGFFLPHLGRDSVNLLSNEEVELCFRIYREGWIIKYIPNAVVYHRVSPERLKKLWFYHRTYWQGRSNAILDINIGNNIYTKLRQYASEMIWRGIEKQENDFENKCDNRLVIGYLHQLLFPQRDNNIEDGFQRFRVFETFLSEVIKTYTRLVMHKDNDLKQFGILLKENDDLLRQKDEQLRQFESLLKQEKEQFRQKCTELTKAEDKFKAKCMEVATKDQDLMRLSEERSAGRQRLMEELRQKDDKINEIMNSYTWKLTAPLRRLHALLLR